MADIPVITVCSIDAVLRDSTAAALLCDLPGAVVVRHDITPEGVLLRSVYDWSGPLDRGSQLLEHGCMSCALRADLLPVLRALTARDRPPATIVVALPVGADARTLVRSLHPDLGGLVPGARPAGVVTAIDPATLIGDLFGDDLLAERELSLGPDDRRAVGEALAGQLEFSDVALAPSSPGARVLSVLRHLIGDHPASLLHDPGAGGLRAIRRPADDPRGDPARIRPTGAPDDEHAWTLHLRSPRPFHPDRLHESVEALGTGLIRGRGVFWLPTRPGTVGVWDGAGGQLSLGTGAHWHGERRTELVISGVGAEQSTVAAAFDRALVSRPELARGTGWWIGRPDGFDPWLGTPDLKITG